MLANSVGDLWKKSNLEPDLSCMFTDDIVEERATYGAILKDDGEQLEAQQALACLEEAYSENAAQKIDEQRVKRRDGIIATGPRTKGTASRFVGVHWSPKSNTWLVKLRNKYVGSEYDEIKAAMLYDEGAAQLGMPLNFPTDEIEPVRKRRRLNAEDAVDPPVSGFKGIVWHRKRSCWKAQLYIPHTRETKHLGYIYTAGEKGVLEALKLYNTAAVDNNLPTQSKN